MSEEKMAAGSPKPSAPEAAPAAAKPKRKPRGLIRWGNLLAIAGLAAAFAFFGVGPVAKWGIQKFGSQAYGAPVTVGRASFDPLRATLTLEDLAVADKSSREGAGGPYKAAAFAAKEAVLAIDVGASLRGQIVIGEVRLTGARGRTVRDVDGSVNGSEPEPPPPGTSPSDPAWRRKLEEKAKSRDLVKDVDDLLKKLREKHDQQVAKKKTEEARRRAEGIGDAQARAEGVRPEQPLIVIRRVIADDVELEMTDKTSPGAPPATISKARVEVKNLSSAPALLAEPIEVHASFAAAPAVLDQVVKSTIPISFGEKTTTAVTSALSFSARDWKLDWRPVLSLANIQAKARDPGSKILGIDAKTFADALTDVQSLDLRDVHVHGEIYDPTVELGDTLKNVVVEALKRKGAHAAAAEIEKGLSKIDPSLKKKIEESPAGDLLKKGQDAVGDKLKGIGDSLFGGDKK